MGRFQTDDNFRLNVDAKVQQQLGRCPGLVEGVCDAGLPAGHEVVIELAPAFLKDQVMTKCAETSVAIDANEPLDNTDAILDAITDEVVGRSMANAIHTITVTDGRFVESAARRLRDRDAAEDVVAETGLSVHRTIRRGARFNCKPVAYIFAALSNHIADYCDDADNQAVPLSSLTKQNGGDVLGWLDRPLPWHEAGVENVDHLLHAVFGAYDERISKQRLEAVLGELGEEELRAIAHEAGGWQGEPDGMTPPGYRQARLRGHTRLRLLLADVLSQRLLLDTLAGSAADHMRRLAEPAWRFVRIEGLRRWLASRNPGKPGDRRAVERFLGWTARHADSDGAHELQAFLDTAELVLPGRTQDRDTQS